MNEQLLAANYAQHVSILYHKGIVHLTFAAICHLGSGNVGVQEIIIGQDTEYYKGHTFACSTFVSAITLTFTPDIYIHITTTWLFTLDYTFVQPRICSNCLKDHVPT